MHHCFGLAARKPVRIIAAVLRGLLDAPIGRSLIAIMILPRLPAKRMLFGYEPALKAVAHAGVRLHAVPGSYICCNRLEIIMLRIDAWPHQPRLVLMAGRAARSIKHYNVILTFVCRACVGIGGGDYEQRQQYAQACQDKLFHLYIPPWPQ